MYISNFYWTKILNHKQGFPIFGSSYTKLLDLQLIYPHNYLKYDRCPLLSSITPNYVDLAK